MRCRRFNNAKFSACTPAVDAARPPPPPTPPPPPRPPPPACGRLEMRRVYRMDAGGDASTLGLASSTRHLRACFSRSSSRRCMRRVPTSPGNPPRVCSYGFLVAMPNLHVRHHKHTATHRQEVRWRGQATSGCPGSPSDTARNARRCCTSSAHLRGAVGPAAAAIPPSLPLHVRERQTCVVRFPAQDAPPHSTRHRHRAPQNPTSARSSVCEDSNAPVHGRTHRFGLN